MGLKLSFEKIMQKDDSKRVTRAESSITQLASEIALRVTQQTFNALQGRVEDAESSLVLQANEIVSKVSQSSYNSKIGQIETNVTMLTQTANSIEAKINATTHTLNSTGYILKDSNGSTLITPNGVANEQNIGRVDNVEAGYGMKIPFHIGSEVSQITQAVLKWDMSNFRTYSKGAASGGGVRTTPSGGGSTSGPSSKTTADNSGPAAFVSNTQTELSYPNEGKHYHRITAEQMAHSHGMAHTHNTPPHVHSLDITHEHAPVFGILETGITVDYAIGIIIDGAYRAQVNATRGEIDLSAWITTNGWHLIELVVNGIKRIDANLFLKTYIRR